MAQPVKPEPMSTGTDPHTLIPNHNPRTRRFCARFAMEIAMRSFNIEQWCELHALSRSFFYKLVKEGNAPKTFKIGATTRISEAANNEWIAAREAAPVAA